MTVGTNEICSLKKKNLKVPAAWIEVFIKRPRVVPGVKGGGRQMISQSLGFGFGG